MLRFLATPATIGIDPAISARDREVWFSIKLSLAKVSIRLSSPSPNVLPKAIAPSLAMFIESARSAPETRESLSAASDSPSSANPANPI